MHGDEFDGVDTLDQSRHERERRVSGELWSFGKVVLFNGGLGASIALLQRHKGRFVHYLAFF